LSRSCCACALRAHLPAHGGGPGRRLAGACAIAHAASSAGADAHADAVVPAIREAQSAGAKTLREIAAALNGRGIATADDGAEYPPPRCVRAFAAHRWHNGIVTLAKK